MNKIDELVNNLCPNGVKVYTLGDLEDKGILKLGRGNVISKDEIKNNPGDYPVYSSSSVGDGEIGRYGKFMFDDERITWSIDGGGKFFYRNNLKYSVTNVGGWLKVLDNNFINTRYLYYSLINSWATQEYNYTKKAHPSVIRNEYNIPVPPIDIQNEVVKVLDKYTDVSSELASVLSSELDDRKKQYRFYLDKLFEFDDSVKVPIFEICDMERGGNFQKKHFTDNGIPAIHYGKIYTYYGLYTDKTLNFIDEEIAKKQKFAENNDIIMAITSENVEDVCKCVVWEGKESVAVSGHSVIIRHKQNARFLAYYFTSSHFQRQKEKYCIGTKVIEMKPDNLAKILIPIPTIEVQNKIVEILDKFYSIINDISIKIPAEIEKRQKQYEYYRDKLLTFKEAEADE